MSTRLPVLCPGELVVGVDGDLELELYPDEVGLVDQDQLPPEPEAITAYRLAMQKGVRGEWPVPRLAERRSS